MKYRENNFFIKLKFILRLSYMLSIHAGAFIFLCGVVCFKISKGIQNPFEN
jgi:hypothetical protein